MTTTEQNKAIVTSFNKDFIESGDVDIFNRLVSDACINRTAPAGSPNGKESMFDFLNGALRPGFPDLKVEILDQVAEGDKVTTRKKITATHSGTFFGIHATGKKVLIDIIDIIRLQDGQYAEHWGMSNLPEIIAELAKG